MTSQEEFYSGDELYTCGICSRVWDGRAQCPCDIDGHDEYNEAYEEYLDNLNGKNKVVLDVSGKVWTESDDGSWTLEPIQEEKQKFSLLSKEQTMKGLFLQIGTESGLPKEIMIAIYNQLRLSIISDQDYVRKHNSHYIYHNILCPEMTPLYSKEWSSYFQSRCPMNRGIEWAIKWEGQHFGLNAFGNRTKEVKARSYLMTQIKILGTESYLFTIVGINDMEGQLIYEPANKGQKMLYLQTSDEEEVQEDYERYINALPGPNQFRLCIDDWGDSTII
jgi:hypothetical protein